MTLDATPGLQFDHLGVVVSDIATGRDFLQSALGVSHWTPLIEDPGLGVTVQFGRAAAGPAYELIAPLGHTSPIHGALRGSKNILNHLAYLTEDIAASGAHLRAAGCYPTGEPHAAVAYGGRSVQFFVSPLRFILELIGIARPRAPLRGTRLRPRHLHRRGPAMNPRPPTLAWLPAEPHADTRLAALRKQPDPAAAWREIEALARIRLDVTQTNRLDRQAQRLAAHAPAPAHLETLRVAVLASSTTQHLLPSLRIAGLRRGFWLELYTNAYGQYLQELLDPHSALHTFQPQAVALLLDAHHVADLAEDGIVAALERARLSWRLAREAFSASIIQQTALPLFEPLLGSSEHRLPASRAAALTAFNAQLRPAADDAGVAILDADALASTAGIDCLHDPALWHLAKQELHPAAAPLFTDHLARVLAAQRGRSAKCLVLDLDNTLWGGVVGDDGVENLQLNKGHAAGEAFLDFQRYVLALKSRGIALAVCSKNDEANARAPFREHPSMLLREDDIACFVANWDDKATNLRLIARTLNLGLDALVFADDNPAERALIRQELPEVNTLELPEDPAGFIRCIARSGAFEAVCCTADDLTRAAQYRANAARASLRETATDLHTYLAGLDMQAHWSPFRPDSLARVVQLINKTNQFNLTTPRVSESDVRGWMADPCMRTWQVRLTDRFGDNGIVALMAARVCASASDGASECALTMLLMSCRVLGRRLEEELFNLLRTAAQDSGSSRITATFRPTAKNSMVRDLPARFGFTPAPAASDGSILWTLETSAAQPHTTEILTFAPSALEVLQGSVLQGSVLQGSVLQGSAA